LFPTVAFFATTRFLIHIVMVSNRLEVDELIVEREYYPIIIIDATGIGLSELAM